MVKCDGPDYSQDIPLTSASCSQQYKLALQSSGRYGITTFKLPPLLRVSQQIRNEASGLFTAVNGFDLNVFTNYVPFAANQTPLFPAAFENAIGVLQVDQDHRDWLAGDKIVFRDIFLNVFSAHVGRNVVGFFGIGGEINKYKWAVRWEIINRTNAQYVTDMFSDITADINEVMKEAQARPDFAGLSLSDLEKIAKLFDYVKPE
jgi:hypothetical protein